VRGSTLTLWPSFYRSTLERLIPVCRKCQERVRSVKWTDDVVNECYRVDFYCHSTQGRMFLPYKDIVTGVRRQLDVPGQQDWPLTRLIVQWFSTGPGDVF
jgi:hypothetical protein